MKKILLVCCLLAGITSVSHAQIFVPETRGKQLQTLLKLSDAQTGKITGYYKILQTQMDSVIKAGGDNDDFGPLMAATKIKIKAVLTPEQNVGYEKMLRESMEQNNKPVVPPGMKRDSTAGTAPGSKQN